MTTKRKTKPSQRPTLEGKTVDQLRNLVREHEFAGRNQAARRYAIIADWLERREKAGFTGELLSMWRQERL